MRIISSDVSLASSRIDVKYSSKFEYLRKWDHDSELIQSSMEENGEIVSESHTERDRVEISALLPDQSQKERLKQLEQGENDNQPSIKEDD